MEWIIFLIVWAILYAGNKRKTAFLFLIIAILLLVYSPAFQAGFWAGYNG